MSASPVPLNGLTNIKALVLSSKNPAQTYSLTSAHCYGLGQCDKVELFQYLSSF